MCRACDAAGSACDMVHFLFFTTQTRNNNSGPKTLPQKHNHLTVPTSFLSVYAGYIYLVWISKSFVGQFSWRYTLYHSVHPQFTSLYEGGLGLLPK